MKDGGLACRIQCWQHHVEAGGRVAKFVFLSFLPLLIIHSDGRPGYALCERDALHDWVSFTKYHKNRSGFCLFVCLGDGRINYTMGLGETEMNTQHVLDKDVSLIGLWTVTMTQLLRTIRVLLPLMELPPLSPGSQERVMEEEVVLETVSRGWSGGTREEAVFRKQLLVFHIFRLL